MKYKLELEIKLLKLLRNTVGSWIPDTQNLESTENQTPMAVCFIIKYFVMGKHHLKSGGVH